MSDSDSALNLSPGMLVGGYTLLNRLGGGAMGTVWRVKDDASTTFAMKILRDSLSDIDSLPQDQQREQVTARERLRREAVALQKIRHPGVAAIVDMELDDALAFIVTELIDGDTLRDDVQQNGAYTGDDLERLADKLISAVRAVHEAGIIHRDIKPTNVMVSSTGPVLVDFGIAMTEGESHVTRTGLVMGTPGFIAPEIIEGAESDENTDLWSLASVLAFAATGKPVFGTKPMMAVLEREAAGNADLGGLPIRTARAFADALNPNVAARPPITELLKAIRADALDSERFGGIGTATIPPVTIPQTAVMPPFLRGREALSPPGGLQENPLGNAQQSARALWADDEDWKEPLIESPVESQTRAFTAVLPASTAVLPIGETTAVQPTAEPAAPATIPPFAIPQPLPPEPLPPQSRITSADAQSECFQKYRRGSKLLPLLLIVPVALLSMALPVISTFLAFLTIWFVTTNGYSTFARFNREQKNGGGRRSDAAVAVLSKPWHIIKGLVRSLPNLLMWLIVGILAIVVTFAFGTPNPIDVAVPFIGGSFDFQLIGGSPRSLGGILLAVIAVVCWVLSVFGFRSRILAIGFGSMWKTLREPFTTSAATLPATEAEEIDNPLTSSPTTKNRANIKKIVLLVALLAVSLACVIVGLSLPTISWYPFS